MIETMTTGTPRVVVPLQAGKQVPAVHLGQEQVERHQGGLKLAGLCKPSSPSGHLNALPGAFEVETKELGRLWGVLHDEDDWPHASPVSMGSAPRAMASIGNVMRLGRVKVKRLLADHALPPTGLPCSSTNLLASAKPRPVPPALARPGRPLVGTPRRSAPGPQGRSRSRVHTVMRTAAASSFAVMLDLPHRG
jgi:hypothetical protein